MNPESKCIWVPGPVIIGAGPSGLAVAACLKQKGIPFLILEKERCVGSLWKLKTYNRLTLHLPKQFCQLPHFAFPHEFPTYPTKQHFISYLEAYAKHFSIRPTFGEEVQCAWFDETMKFWQVQTRESKFLCRWLIVATGENAEAVVPDIAGIKVYRGSLLHTSIYRSGGDFSGKKVLVVGCGNSGMEISLDLCNSGAHVSLVVRDKLHILPMEILGQSTFSLAMWLLKWFRIRIVDQFLLCCSRMIIGETESIGIRRPEVGPLQLKNFVGKTPVLDVGTVAKIRSGDIKVVCGIRRFTSNGVLFVDGKTDEFDSVILATGYKSNVTSWLKDGSLFSKVDGHPRNQFPKSWKGNNGLYSVGFTRSGLLGTSMDAEKVAEDIHLQWFSETKHLRVQS